MFWEPFKITGLAVTQIFLISAIGYFLVKKGMLKASGLDIISRLVIEVSLPLLIICQLMKNFRFTLYPKWYIFPLISIGITLAGLIAGGIFTGFIKGLKYKLQFLSLVTFQNSGYLPLALVATLLPIEKIDIMFIYIFLFLLGFNSIMWSLGVYMLTFSRVKKFELGSIFSPCVIATVFGLIFIFFGLNKIIPEFIYRPLKTLGDCTLPLAMLVTGGSLALIELKEIDKRAILLLILTKLVILPLLGLGLIIKFRLPELLGLLIIIELAAPSAVSLSLITRHYKKEDLLISQGIFFSHIASLITIPVFLSSYFTLIVIK